MIEIETLGRFMIKVNGADISDAFTKTRKLMQLLSLLIVNMGKPLPANAIYDAIWNDDGSTDTYKALSNLVFRMRKNFKGAGVNNGVLHNNKSFMLNDALDYAIDIHQYEDLCHRAQDAQASESEKRELLQQAVALYRGEYIFSAICDDEYSQRIAYRYKHMYSEAACLLADLHTKAGEHNTALQICNQAIAHDPLDEQVFLRMIQSLAHMGRGVQAIKLIEEYFDLMQREVGVRESEAIDSIYKELKGTANSPTKTRIGQIVDELQEIGSLSKPVFCSYTTFVELYRYELRRQERKGFLIFTAVAELRGDPGADPSDAAIASANKHLQESCMLSLRKGDAFAAYSPTQTLVMCILAKEEDKGAILSRLRRQYNARAKKENVHLHIETHVLAP